ncbi:MAG: hypothetical protein KDD43_07805, partial [Bdellovibrionales bacterium]|nr:hypothetical protein [Bdellovibrionales bacterium]
RRLASVQSGEFMAVTESRGQAVGVGYAVSGNFSKVSALIARFSHEGEFLSTKEIHLGGTTQAHAAASTRDGGLVIGGSLSHHDGTSEQGFILRLSADDKIEWAHLTPSQMRIQAVEIDTNGDIVATGSREDQDAQWAVQAYRLTADGRILSQIRIGERMGSSFSGKAMTLDERGNIRIAFNSALVGGSYNPIGLIRLDGQESSCDQVSEDTSQTQEVSSTLATTTSNWSANEGQLVATSYPTQTEVLPISDEKICL